jgi:hypothetical protein
MKPILSYSDGAITIRLSLRGLSSVVRLMALGVHETLYWRIHPLGRTPQSILRRNALERGQ